jgi:hypothetical protein
MIKKVLFSVLAILLSLTALRAEETQNEPAVPKKKMLIYSFVPVDNSGKYIYLSTIIPSTLAKNINKGTRCEAVSSEETRPILPATAGDEEKKAYLDAIAGAQTDYVITGYCEIIENPKVIVNGKNELILKIKIQLFDVASRRYENIDFSSQEVGVILKETIDEISAGIEGKIAVYEAQKKEEEKPSPFLGAHRSLSRVTFGIEMGEFFILDKWADLYNWSMYVKPYMSIRIIDYMGLNLSYDYFSSDNEDIKGVTTRSYLEIHTVALGVYGMYRFIKYIDVMASLSAGVSISSITFENDSNTYGPFTDPLAEEESIDPSMELGASIGFHLSSVVLRAGFSYRCYFYTDEYLQGMTVYGSLGYNF